MSETMEQVRAALRDRYSVDREIGRGAMGTVFRAVPIGSPTAAPAAIKIFPIHGDEDRARFRSEVASVARLEHPNILRIIDSGEFPGFCYHVTPFIEGKSVDRLLEGDQSFSVRDALTICECVASALAHAHGLGIIHRDIKPGNVIIPTVGGKFQYDRALLADFGAVGLIAPETNMTQAGQIFGTPLYMSPEQIVGKPQTTAADVYGVGALLYRMIFGQPPFRGENLVELMYRIINEPMTVPDVRTLPAELFTFIERCLAKDPALRPTRIDDDIHRLRGLVAPDELIAETRILGPAQSFDGSLGRTLQPSAQRASRAAVVDAPPPRAVPVCRSRAPYWIAGVLAAFTLAIVAIVIVEIDWSPRALGITSGVALMLGGAAAGVLLFRWIRMKGSALQRDAGRILDVATQKTDLSSSLVLEVNQLLARCRGLDEQFLGKSIAIMVGEYQAATKFDDRHAALVTAVDFMEKLSRRIAPWYVRHDKLIAFVVSAVGIASGVVTMIDTLLKIE